MKRICQGRGEHSGTALSLLRDFSAVSMMRFRLCGVRFQNGNQRSRHKAGEAKLKSYHELHSTSMAFIMLSVALCILVQVRADQKLSLLLSRISINTIPKFHVPRSNSQDTSLPRYVLLVCMLANIHITHCIHIQIHIHIHIRIHIARLLLSGRESFVGRSPCYCWVALN